MPVAITVEVEWRQILKKGSSRLWKESTLAEAKYLRGASSDFACTSASSTQTISS